MSGPRRSSSRRDILKLTGVSGFLALAGCSSVQSGGEPGSEEGEPSTSSSNESTAEDTPSLGNQYYRSLPSLGSDGSSEFGDSAATIRLQDVYEHGESFELAADTGEKPNPVNGPIEFDPANIEFAAANASSRRLRLFHFTNDQFRNVLEDSAEQVGEYQEWEMWTADDTEDIYAVKDQTVIRVYFPDDGTTQEQVKLLIDGFSGPTDTIYNNRRSYADVADAITPSSYSMISARDYSDWFENAEFMGIGFSVPEPGRIETIAALGFSSGGKPDPSSIQEILTSETDLQFDEPEVTESEAAVVLSGVLNKEAYGAETTISPTKIRIENVSGVVEGDKVSTIEVTVSVAEGESTDLTKASVFWYGPEEAKTLMYGGEATGEEFTITGIDESALREFTSGQTAKIVVDSTAVGSALSAGDNAALKLVSAGGENTEYQVSVPESIGNGRIDL